MSCSKGRHCAHEEDSVPDIVHSRLPGWARCTLRPMVVAELCSSYVRVIEINACGSDAISRPLFVAHKTRQHAGKACMAF